jgi:hypothetical protein
MYQIYGSGFVLTSVLLIGSLVIGMHPPLLSILKKGLALLPHTTTGYTAWTVLHYLIGCLMLLPLLWGAATLRVKTKRRYLIQISSVMAISLVLLLLRLPAQPIPIVTSPELTTLLSTLVPQPQNKTILDLQALEAEPSDLILSPYNTIRDPRIAQLFTQEFYQKIAHALTPNGIFVQQLPLSEISVPVLASIIKALVIHLPYFQLYYADDASLFLVSAPAPIARTMTGKYYLGDQTHFTPLFQTFVLNANSHFFPIAERFSERDYFLGLNSHELIQLKTGPMPSLAWLFPDLPLILSAEQRKTLLDEFSNKKILCEHPVLVYRWFAKIQPILEQTFPYLSTIERKKIWARIKPKACWESSPEYIRDWLTLYDAFFTEDYTRSFNAAITLFPKTPTEIDVTYLRISQYALLSAFKMSQYDFIRQYWQHFSSTTNIPLFVRMIYAHSRTVRSK